MSVFSTLFVVFLSLSLIAFVFLKLTPVRQPSPIVSAKPDTISAPRVARFLFKSGALVDADANALRICAEAPVEVFDWSMLRQRLAGSFPDFPHTQGTFHDRDITVLTSQDPKDASIITLDQWNDVARVTLELDDAPDLARRTAVLQAMFQAPNPIWKEDYNGTVIWRNRAYKSLGATLGYPPNEAQLFDTTELEPGDPQKLTQLLSLNDTPHRWFNITAVRTIRDVMYYATEADAEVAARNARSSFVQSFSKTFAHLSIGLVIFDENQNLVLFNPALKDLTGLSVEFLSNRCTLVSFFDQLRERHVVPEPTGKTTWRDQVSGIVAESQNERYCETWTLPTGVTYRVTGRPHPEGALAFLFEDITAEITVTRRFRSELEQVHLVLDTMSTGAILFADNGQLRMSNHAYRTLWKSDPDSSFAEYTLRDALAHWQSDCHANPCWGRLRKRVLSTTDRSTWSAHISMKSGTELQLRVSPVSGGCTLLTFDVIDPWALMPLKVLRLDISA